MKRFRPCVEAVEGRVVLSRGIYGVFDAISHALGTDHGTTGSTSMPVVETPNYSTHQVTVRNTSGLTATIFTDYYNPTTHAWTRQTFQNVPSGKSLPSFTAANGKLVYVGASAPYGTKPNLHFYQFGQTTIGQFPGSWSNPGLQTYQIPATTSAYTISLPNYRTMDG